MMDMHWRKGVYMSALLLPLLILAMHAGSKPSQGIAFAAQSAGDPTLIFPQTQSFQTSYNPPVNPFASQNGPNLPLSPANNVYNYNYQNANYLITCPYQPEPYPLDQQYFYSGGQPTTYIAGDECLANPSSITTQINSQLIVNQPPVGIPTASQTVNVVDASVLVINALSYSPEADGNTVSTSFQNQSNIFHTFPLASQHSVWTWNGLYANFQNAQTMTTSSGPISGIVQNGKCINPYTYTAVLTVSNFRNTYVPFNEVIPNSQDPNQYNSQYNNFQSNVYPYLLHNTSLSNLDTVSNAIQLNFSYDIYSPWNYYNPSNSEEPYPIDIPSLFLAQYVPNQGNPSLQTFQRNPTKGLGVDLSTPSNIVSVLSSTNGGQSVGTGPSSSFAQTIWNDLIAAGYTPVEAAGIMGNAAQETGGQHYQNINPECDQPGCYGFVSWEASTLAGYNPPVTPEQIVTGNPTADVQTQINILVNPNQAGAGPGASWWQGVATPIQAADAFQNNFERCGQCNTPVREEQATEVYAAATAGGWSQGNGAATTTGGQSGQISIDAVSVSGLSSDYMYLLANGGKTSTTGISGSTGSIAIPFSSDYFTQSCGTTSFAEGDPGQDYCLPELTPVYAIYSGTVQYANSPGDTNWGDRLLLNLGNGWQIGYGHLCRELVPDGSQVTAGEEIALSGGQPGNPECPNYGISTGAHIEMQLISPTYINGGHNGGTFINPGFLLNKLYSVNNGAPPGAPIPGADGCQIWQAGFPSSNQGSNSPPPPPDSPPPCPSGTGSGGGIGPSSNGGATVYVMRLFNHGNYNSSVLPPNSVAFANDQSTWDQNWKSYWSSVIKLQDSSAYVINGFSIDPSKISSLQSELSQQGLSYQSFTPYNVSSDDFGDVFVIGSLGTGSTQNNGDSGSVTDTASVPVIISVTNTISGPVTVSGAIVTDGSKLLLHSKFTEIAASPTGKIVFIAGPGAEFPYDHNILAYDGTDLSYVSNFNLVFSNDVNGQSGFGSQPFLVNGACDTGKLTPKPVTSPLVNILDYMAYGGFFGVNAIQNNGGLSSELWQILQNAGITGVNQNGDIIVSHDNIPNEFDRDCYHTPLAIQDVNGYLYVLDQWSGRFGETCAKLGIKPIGVGGSFSCDGGVIMNMVMLRVINSTGSDVPINPTLFNDIWLGKTRLSALDSIQSQFPPYGWILSGTVADGWGTGHNQKALEFCMFGGSATDEKGYSGDKTTAQCQMPNPVSDQYASPQLSPQVSSYQPLLPFVNPWSCQQVTVPILGTLINFDCKPDRVEGIGFSVSANSTVTVFMPTGPYSQSTSQQVQDTTHVANRDNELLFLRLNVENYTKFISSTGPDLHYVCYSDAGDLSSGTTYPNGAQSCTSNQYVNQLATNKYKNHPVYLMSNPFEYTEGVGSSRLLTYEGAFYSSFSGSVSSGNSGNAKKYQNSGEGYGSSVTPGTIGSLANQGYQTGPNGEPIVVSPQPTTINSIIGGYLVVPYAYHWDVAETWTILPAGPNCPGSGPFNRDTNGDVYAYATNSAASNNNIAAVEGGSSYAEYISNQTFYQQNDIAATLPPQIGFDLATNRQFGDVYINTTLDTDTNQQSILNATRQKQYFTVNTVQGSYPGYATLSSTPVNPTCYGSDCAAPLADISRTTDPSNNYTVNQTQIPALVALFNWDRSLLYSAAVYLNLNSTKTKNLFGYHRLVYVYNDRFNNTIYQPIDADIANITTITLKTNPIINASNPNQTQIFINGTAQYTPVFSSAPVPLRNGKIYLYYDYNINYANYNPATQAAQVQLCAFGNGTVGAPLSTCTTANPLRKGLQAAWADTPTYYPKTQLNSPVQCEQPASSLLYTAPYQCNIYGKFSLPQTCQSSEAVPGTGGQLQVAQDFCVPQWQNGTGYCTTQLGLISTVQTDQYGNFTYNAIACGAGYHSIIASFYGEPAGTETAEPIQISQPPVQYAYNPGAPQSQYTKFLSNDYSWTPTTSAQGIAIGSFLISYGQIGAMTIILGLAIVATVWLTRGAYNKGGKRRKSRRS